MTVQMRGRILGRRFLSTTSFMPTTETKAGRTVLEHLVRTKRLAHVKEEWYEAP